MPSPLRPTYFSQKQSASTCKIGVKTGADILKRKYHFFDKVVESCIVEAFFEGRYPPKQNNMIYQNVSDNHTTFGVFVLVCWVFFPP